MVNACDAMHTCHTCNWPDNQGYTSVSAICRMFYIPSHFSMGTPTQVGVILVVKGLWLKCWSFTSGRGSAGGIDHGARYSGM